MKKRKRKYYRGTWCVICHIFIPDRKKDIRLIVCDNCGEELRHKLDGMREGVYLTTTPAHPHKIVWSSNKKGKK